MRSGIGAEIDRRDPLAHEDMLVVAELTGPRRNARIARATGIDALDVEPQLVPGGGNTFHVLAAHGLRAAFDEGRLDVLEEVRHLRILRLAALLLS